MYSFFAMMARMKNIERWALMRNSVQENISEHSLEVAMLAHGLSLIANEKCGKHVDSNEIALMGMYHDANEIITETCLRLSSIMMMISKKLINGWSMLRVKRWWVNCRII